MTDTTTLFETFVDVSPVPKRRPRVNTRTGHAYTPQDTRLYEREVAWKLRAAMGGREPLAGDVSVTMEFYRAKRNRADLDNLIKAFWDAANGIVYKDDKQIVGITARVTYGSKTPGTRVKVEAA